MHLIECGTIKTLFEKIFSSSAKNKLELKELEMLNKKFQLIKLPHSEGTRRFPQIDVSKREFKRLKAHEYGFIMQHYTYLFEGILDEKVYKILTLFGSGYCLITKNSISKEDLIQAFHYFHDYLTLGVQEFGESFLTLKNHGLIEILRNIRDLGPIHGFSAKGFESLNGKLLRCVNGTKDSTILTLNSFQLKTVLKHVFQNLPNLEGNQINKQENELYFQALIKFGIVESHSSWETLKINGSSKQFTFKGFLFQLNNKDLTV
jgi:hypothetical protein